MTARSPMSPSFAPNGNAQTYKDVLRFESRLIQNAERLTLQRRKFQGFLAALVTSILFLAYCVFIDPSIYSVVHYTFSGLLLIAVTSLVLFFATGVYTEKIAAAYKFVPQANRSLRPFNMHLNTNAPGYFSFLNFWSKPVVSARMSTRSTPVSPSKGSEKSRPTSPSDRTPLQTMPVASNPKGEIMFSHRVDSGFVEGYERYRAEWERRKNTSGVPSGTTTARSANSQPSTMPRLPRRLSRSSEPTTPPLSREGSPDSAGSGRSNRKPPSFSSRGSSPPSLSHSRPASADSSGPPSPRDEQYDQPFFYSSKDANRSRAESFTEYFQH